MLRPMACLIYFTLMYIFLNAFWDARNSILFSDQVFTFRAQKPRSESAS
jgi:hypothetical protein